MPQPYGKALTNESIYPNIAELAVTGGGLEVELARQIIDADRPRSPKARAWSSAVLSCPSSAARPPIDFSIHSVEDLANGGMVGCLMMSHSLV
jgi:hypothetical protein